MGRGPEQEVSATSQFTWHVNHVIQIVLEKDAYPCIKSDHPICVVLDLQYPYMFTTFYHIKVDGFTCN